MPEGSLNAIPCVLRPFVGIVFTWTLKSPAKGLPGRFKAM